MKPHWRGLASLAQEMCTRSSFGSLVQSLLPKDTILRTYLHSKDDNCELFRKYAWTNYSPIE